MSSGTVFREEMPRGRQHLEHRTGDEHDPPAAPIRPAPGERPEEQR